MSRTKLVLLLICACWIASALLVLGSIWCSTNSESNSAFNMYSSNCTTATNLAVIIGLPLFGIGAVLTLIRRRFERHVSN